MTLLCVRVRWLMVCLGIAGYLVSPGVDQAFAQGRIVGISQFPSISIKDFQNAKFAGSVANDRKVLLGSVGSDLWRGAEDAAGEFWMVTDRGPNGQIRVDGANRRTFWVPEFNPAIVRVKLERGAIKLLETVPIVGRSGKPITGMPNFKTIDETPYDYTAQKEFGFNVNGLDTEGLIRTKSGEFWLADEYSPSLIHADKTGKVIKRYVPAGLKLPGADYPVQESLPAIFGKRKINRGFEGLAVSADEKTLYAVLQSPLANPDRKIGDASRNTRVVVFDRDLEQVTAEYVYRFEVAKDFDPRPKMSPDEMKLSAVVYLNPTTLLILERTDWSAKLYSVDLTQATNILKSKWDEASTTPSLEALDDPASAAIRVLPKTLVLDLNQFKEMPEKIEGVTVIDRNTIAVANDNDFDSEESKYDEQGNNIGKGKVSQILVIALDKPLPLAK
jgi:Esterase-like activity of phytase